MKRITVSKGKVTVALDFSNQSDKEFKLAAAYTEEADLSDEKGNIFEFRGGLNTTWYDVTWGFDKWTTLNPKSNNDVALYFTPKDRDITVKDIGSVFAFSLRYVLYDPKDKSKSMYNVSFTDIKAQKPK